MKNGYEPVVRVLRGDVEESVHFGAIAVANASGKLLASWGNPELVTFMRSSAKPFQALPLVESGALDSFGLSAEDLALFCASHAGTDAHVRRVEQIQSRVGLRETDLQCGTHAPFDRATAFRLQAEGQLATPNRHNCSGKHTGMLAQAKHLGAPLETYLAPDNQVQQRILSALAALAGMDEADIRVGTDGCSAPNFALPLRAAATAYARLADPSGLSKDRARACERILAAMTGYPAMVSGEGRLDTVLMNSAPGVLSKGGAEGYQGLAIRAQARDGGEAVGVAAKISDGDLASRAQAVMVLSLLQQLGVKGAERLADLPPFNASQMTNHAGITVGAVESCFTLESA
jgi:L-asparaginase II